MKTYDVIVIGSGGGAKITSPAAKLGLKVACIEKDKLGGTCLNRGCIPSKMLIYPAEIARTIKNAKRYSIHNNPEFSVDFAGLIARISNTVDADSASIVEGYRKNPNIDFYNASAKFTDHKVLEVNGERMTADKIFIAAGSRPQIPNIPGLQGTPYMTSTEALRNTKLPQCLIVVGGGYIAVELGYAYAALGCEVHFIVRSKFLKNEDDDVIEEFTRAFSRDHHVHLNCKTTRVSCSGGVFTVGYEDADGFEKELKADALLIATGVVSNADTLDLQKTAVDCGPARFVKVDECLQTSVPGIYAMGDCIGRYLFRHSVNFEGEYLFDTIFGGKPKRPIKYPPVPHAVFTHPQIAGVGLTERQAKALGIDYVLGVNSYKSSAMGMAMMSDSGFCKILIERQSRKIIGAHIIGDDASNMIHMLIAFMCKDGTLDDLLNMIYIHPALAEVVRNAARKAKINLEQCVVRGA